MAKYLVLSETDTSRTPEDPKTKKAQWLGFQELIMKQLKEGVLKEWGFVVGEMRAFAIFEGSAVDLQTLTASWVPFVKFKVSELLMVSVPIEVPGASVPSGSTVTGPLIWPVPPTVPPATVTALPAERLPLTSSVPLLTTVGPV